MKNFLSCFLVLFIIFSFVACGKSKKSISNSFKSVDDSSIIVNNNSSKETTIESKNSNNNSSHKSTSNSYTSEKDIPIDDKGYSENGQDNSNNNSVGEITRAVGNDKNHIYRSAYDMGSCRFLSDQVYVYCFFVDDNESSWNAKESDEFINEQINPALDFLINQAKIWNINLSFNIKSFCKDSASFSLKYNGIINKDLMNGGSTKDVFKQITNNMGYLSEKDYSQKQDEINRSADTIYLTFINKNGRSYTRNLYNEDAAYYIDDETPEYSVIFSKNIDSFSSVITPKERSATIAHEILHLFGGEDYYSNKRLPLANKFYFYDIMTLNTYNISQLQLMEMTAFSIGWTDIILDICYNQSWIDGRFP